MAHKTTNENLDSLLKIMQALRAREGCPWDIEQTPESLAPYIIEEACELIDAIESGNEDLILEELGDLLLQVVFQAQIFSEREKFDFDDVAATIADKLIRRHPHVFNRCASGTTGQDLDQQWEDIKQNESTQKKSCIADHLPANLPALQRAQKLISRARKSEPQVELPDVSKQLKELCIAGDGQIGHVTKDDIGQALFHIVKLAHEAGIDAEGALRNTTRLMLHELDSK